MAATSIRSGSRLNTWNSGASIAASINQRPSALTARTDPGTRKIVRMTGGMSKSTLGSTQAGVRW